MLVLAAGFTLPGCVILPNLAAPVVETPLWRVSIIEEAPVEERAVKASYPRKASRRVERPEPIKELRKTTGVGDRSACDTSSDCVAQLRALVESEKREWIGRTVPAAEYATGVRLFAYRALRARLTCKELALALNEVDAATRTLHSPIAGVTPEQVDRVRILNAQVEVELRAERARRCGA
jgi:hypothetical protein